MGGGCANNQVAMIEIFNPYPDKNDGLIAWDNVKPGKIRSRNQAEMERMTANKQHRRRTAAKAARKARRVNRKF